MLDLPAGAPPPPALLEFLARHGANTDSFQASARHHRRLFSDDAGLVAFARVGRFTVVAGDPIAPPGRLTELIAAVRNAYRGPVVLVSASAPVRDELAAAGWGWLKVGEEPFWEPSRWTLDGKAVGRVRHGVKGAENKGIRVVQAPTNGESWTQDLADMTAVAEAWRRSHPIRQLGFLLTLAPFERPAASRYFIARDPDGHAVAFLSAVPIYARRGWYFQDFVRHPDAPNGVIELLFHQAMLSLRDEGAHLVTLGAAPLAGLDKEPPDIGWLSRTLRFAYEHLDGFYHFQSLGEYKQKFAPHWWESKYLVFTPRRLRARLLFAVLKAYDERGATSLVLSRLGRALKEELAIDPETGRPKVVDQALALPGLLLSQDLVVAAVLALGIGSAIGIVGDHLHRQFDDVYVALAASLPAALLTVAILRAKDRYEART